ncbi:MAG: four-carbon acid sugar kinase family protein [Thermogutta sp.]
MMETFGSLGFPEKEKIFQALPTVWTEPLLWQIQERIFPRGGKVVVLDDDPTGTQTVYDIPVITKWSVETLRRELVGPEPGFYILTNSRSLGPAESEALHRQLGQNLVEAARPKVGADKPMPLCIISRSDSTLRGHFPLEVNILAEVVGKPDAVFVVPFFAEGGRFTIDNTHFLAQGSQLVPVAATPFAQDPVFGYKAWNLREWIVEKSRGAISGERIRSISLDDLRGGGPSYVANIIRKLPSGTFCIVNAADYQDIAVFVLAVLEAEAEGKRFLFRSAASLVAMRLGLKPRPLLSPQEICDRDSSVGGLVVCGSYVSGSTRQLQELVAEAQIDALEFNVAEFVRSDSAEHYVATVTRDVRNLLQAGRHVVIFTSRQYVGGKDAQQSLEIGRNVAAALARIIRELGIRPRFLIAKGGITSSEIATKGLQVSRAIVRGQALPGVPVWELDEHTLYPGLKYIVFPGNVGGSDALVCLVRSLVAESRGGTG